MFQSSCVICVRSYNFVGKKTKMCLFSSLNNSIVEIYNGS
ncbi:hypothetical protein LCGC14_0529030 [marine sediment metagenome]|uniref:Uncharacterized protein n=1 Tax=marine sediment metagenome TaxID=412755 RepID=A0A0F9S0T9_9ZZZZ